MEGKTRHGGIGGEERSAEKGKGVGEKKDQRDMK